MTVRAPRRQWPILLALVGLVVSAAASVLAPAVGTGAQAADPPFTVTFGDTTELADAQTIDVAIAMRSGVTASAAAVYLCRPGATYATVTDVLSNSGKCPGPVPVSGTEPSIFQIPVIAGGTRAQGQAAALSGVAEWSSSATDERFTLRCDAANPCQLVVRVDTTAGEVLLDASTQVTYAADDGFAGCGGGAEAAPGSAGADRVIDAWREWTRSQCAGSGLASTRPPVPGEGEGLAAFAAGGADIAYTAAGYDAPGFAPPDLAADERRAAVPTPVALNAVVLAAAGGWYPTPAERPDWPEGLVSPYSDIRMTPGQIAELIGRGPVFVDPATTGAVLAANPELGSISSSDPTSSATLALSSTSAVSMVMTSWLDQRAPDAWRGNPLVDNAERGVDANFGIAEPSYTTSGTLNVVSDMSLIDRAIYRFTRALNPQTPGPQWVLTDLSTATRLGLVPVSVQNAAGDFVRPTPESLAAAVPVMTPRTDGTLAPPLDTSAPGAYPLTMVEYAVAPAEPLVDQACAPRTESQELLDGWLAYITGDAGQSVLPPGFVPLTPALRTAAAEAVDAVGASPSTCVPPGGPPPTTPPTTPPTPPTTPGGSAPAGDLPLGGYGPGSDGGYGDFGTDPSSGDGAAAGPRDSTAEDRRQAARAAADAEPELPPFLGIAAVSAMLPPTAVLLIVALTSVAAFGTSGRPLPVGVTARGRALGRSLGRAGRATSPRRVVGGIGQLVRRSA